MGFFGDIIRKGFELARDFIDRVANRIKTAFNTVVNKVKSFFIKAVDWLERTYEKISQVCKVFVEASQLFVKRVAEGFVRVTKNYSKQNDGQWRCDTVTETHEISKDEVPPEIREKVKHLQTGQQADISMETKRELELAV